MSFLSAFDKTVGHEGGYSYHAADKGGATRFGITEKVARAYGYKGEMKSLPLNTAREIYKRDYWDAIRGDDISLVSSEVAEKLFDIGVNMGTGIAVRFLQRALSVLCKQSVSVDGIIGSLTIKALSDYINGRGKPGTVAVINLIRSQQGMRYIEICERDPVQKAFASGWAIRVST